MLDVTVTTRLRHADLWASVKKFGSVKALADHLDCNYGKLIDWVNLWDAPPIGTTFSNSKFSDLLWVAGFEQKLFELTGKSLDELWPKEQRESFRRPEAKAIEVTRRVRTRSLELMDDVRRFIAHEDLSDDLEDFRQSLILQRQVRLP